MARERNREPEAVRITSAAASRNADIAARQKRYLISMSIRTACFLLAVVTHGPLRWVLVAAAVVLPYIAVVMANAVGSGAGDAPTTYVPQQSALDSAQHETLAPAEPQPTPQPTPKPTAQPTPAAEDKPAATL